MIPVTELLTVFKSGDKGVFDKVYRRYYSEIFSFVKYKFALKEDVAEDVTHEIMLKAYQKLDDLKDKEKIKSWLFRIAKNHCINLKTRIKDLFTIDETKLKSSEKELVDEIQKKENCKVLKECLKKLYPKERVIFVIQNVYQRTWYLY